MAIYQSVTIVAEAAPTAAKAAESAIFMEEAILVAKLVMYLPRMECREIRSVSSAKRRQSI